MEEDQRQWQEQGDWQQQSEDIVLTEELWKKLDRIDQDDLDPIWLNDLIKKLKAVDKNKLVKIIYSDGSVAYPNVLEREFINKFLYNEKTCTCLVSFRMGVFVKLSVDISKTEKKVTVGSFLEQCEYIIGKGVYGYKGRLYTIDGRKTVYVSEASEGDKCAIFDAKETGDEVHLIAKRYLCGWF